MDENQVDTMPDNENQEPAYEGTSEMEQNKIYLPEGVKPEAKAGDEVELTITGKIIEENGQMFIAVQAVDGKNVSAPSEEKSKINDIENRLTDKLKERDMSMRGQADNGEEF
jgi:hypothetical protein